MKTLFEKMRDNRVKLAKANSAKEEFYKKQREKARPTENCYNSQNSGMFGGSSWGAAYFGDAGGPFSA